MKKAFISLMLTIVSAIVLNAQSLTGKPWYTVITDEDGTDIVVSYTFEDNGTCELVIATEYEMKEDDVPILLTGGVTVPGTFSLKGDDLKVNLNKRKAEVELDYEIKGMDPEVKKLMDKEIGAEIKGLRKEFKDEMLNGLPKTQTMKVVSLDKNELVLRDEEGDEIPFYSE